MWSPEYCQCRQYMGLKRMGLKRFLFIFQNCLCSFDKKKSHCWLSRHHSANGVIWCNRIQKLQNQNMDAELNVYVITFWSPLMERRYVLRKIKRAYWNKLIQTVMELWANFRVNIKSSIKVKNRAWFSSFANRFCQYRWRKWEIFG